MINQNLQYWLKRFPFLQAEMEKMDKTITNQKQVIDQQQKIINIQKQQLQAYKEQTDKMNQQQQLMQKMVEEANKRVITTKIDDDQLWSAWKKYVKSILPEYVPPTQSANSEFIYISYVDRQKCLLEFQKRLVKELTAQHIRDPRVANINELTESLKNISFGKL